MSSQLSATTSAKQTQLTSLLSTRSAGPSDSTRKTKSKKEDTPLNIELVKTDITSHDTLRDTVEPTTSPAQGVPEVKIPTEIKSLTITDNNGVEKIYTYESTNKNGKVVTKKVVRKYSNKKNTSNTLQNKANKDIVEKNINDNYDKIMELAERKRMTYIKENCVPKEISASYNTLKSIWNKILTSKQSETPDSPLSATGPANK